MFTFSYFTENMLSGSQSAFKSVKAATVTELEKVINKKEYSFKKKSML